MDHVVFPVDVQPSLTCPSFRGWYAEKCDGHPTQLCVLLSNAVQFEIFEMGTSGTDVIPFVYVFGIATVFNNGQFF